MFSIETGRRKLAGILEATLRRRLSSLKGDRPRGVQGRSSRVLKYSSMRRSLDGPSDEVDWWDGVKVGPLDMIDTLLSRTT